MDQPEDKGPKPETPGEPAAGGVWLPPRLRQKLETPTSGDDFDFLKTTKPNPMGAIITGVVVVAVLAGAWMVFQNNQRKAREAAEKKAADIASDLQMAAGTVRVARHRALMRLRECVTGGSLQ